MTDCQCKELQNLKEEIEVMKDRRKCLVDQIEHLKCYLKIEDHQVKEQSDIASKQMSQLKRDNAKLKKMVQEMTEEAMCLKAISDSMYRKLTDDNGGEEQEEY